MMDILSAPINEEALQNQLESLNILSDAAVSISQVVPLVVSLSRF
jgi:hypothetical protein